MKFVAKLSILLPISERNSRLAQRLLYNAAAGNERAGETWMHEFGALEGARTRWPNHCWINSHESVSRAAKKMTHLEVQNDGPDETQDELGIPVNNVLCSDVHQLYLQINVDICQNSFFISTRASRQNKQHNSSDAYHLHFFLFFALPRLDNLLF